MIGKTNFTNCENFERFHRSKLKKIEGKAKLSLASASLCGALITKIILLIFTTTNDSLNLAHRLLIKYSDLEKQNIKIFWKNITLARAPTLRKNIEESSY